MGYILCIQKPALRFLDWYVKNLSNIWWILLQTEILKLMSFQLFKDRLLKVSKDFIYLTNIMVKFWFSSRVEGGWSFHSEWDGKHLKFSNNLCQITGKRVVVLPQPNSGIRFTNSPLTSFAKLCVLRPEPHPVEHYRSLERAVFLRETRGNNSQEITRDLLNPWSNSLYLNRKYRKKLWMIQRKLSVLRKLNIPTKACYSWKLQCFQLFLIWTDLSWLIWCSWVGSRVIPRVVKLAGAVSINTCLLSGLIVTPDIQLYLTNHYCPADLGTVIPY